MPEIDGSPIQISQTHEAEHTISPYGGIERLSQWIETSLDLTGAEAEFPDPNRGVALAIANHVGNCLPIEKGRGHATIPEQLVFWETNQELFTTFIDRRPSAIELVSSRESIIREKNSATSILHSIQSDLNLLKTEMYSQDYTEQISKLTTDEHQLLSAIENCSTTLEQTSGAFESNKRLLESIVSKIDCKLPTVLTGHMLQKMGWTIQLFCVMRPEHPVLMASKNQPNGELSQFTIDYVSVPSKFKSDPQINIIRDPRKIPTAKRFAQHTGFISDQDQWPLPFTEETFRRFDDWYVSHTPQETSPNQ